MKYDKSIVMCACECMFILGQSVKAEFVNVVGFCRGVTGTGGVGLGCGGKVCELVGGVLGSL